MASRFRCAPTTSRSASSRAACRPAGWRDEGPAQRPSRARRTPPRRSPAAMLKRIISRPIGACFIALSMALLGVMALHQLPVALLPPVELPVITVRCDKAGASAIELEDQLLRPLEQALSTVPSLTSMEGLANAGAVEVRLSIRADADLEAITNRLRERLSGIPLPVGTDPPRVLRFDPSTEPLMRLILEPVAGGPNATTLAAIARDEFTPQVEGLS